MSWIKKKDWGTLRALLRAYKCFLVDFKYLKSNLRD